MAISSIGVGSGLPLSDLLSQLESNERQSLNVYTSRATAEQTRFSAYGTIKSGLEALQKAAQTLGQAATFGALKASTTSEAFTAGTQTGAIAGQYKIEVKELATSQSLKSAGQASRENALSTSDVTIQVKLANSDTPVTLTLAAKDTSLNGIVQAFNNSADVGVNATLINDGKAVNPHYLLLNARGTGTESAIESITITGDDTAALEAALGFTQGDPASALTEQAATNARLFINDTEISSQTNTVQGAIDGVTLTLNKESTKVENLSITADNSVTEKAINAFVTAYNNVQNTIKSLTSYNTETQQGSALTGDSVARRVQTQLSQALSSASASTGLNLSKIGITTDPTNGNLKVDNSKLSDTMKSNMQGVKELFSGDNGISKTIEATTTQFVKTGGILASATDSITRTLKSLEQQYESASARIDARAASYQKQFQQLDIMMAQMNSTSTYLTQQFSALANLNSSNNK